MGSNVPPITPKRHGRPSAPSFARNWPSLDCSTEPQPALKKSLTFKLSFVMLASHLARPTELVFVRGKRFEREGAAHVQLLRGDANFSTKPEAAAIGETGRSVCIHRSGIDACEEFLGASAPACVASSATMHSECLVP